MLHGINWKHLWEIFLTSNYSKSLWQDLMFADFLEMQTQKCVLDGIN